MKTFYSLILLFFLSMNLSAQGLFLDAGMPPEEMIIDFFDNDIINISNVTFEGAPTSTAYFESEFETSDIEAGLYMCTGHVFDAYGPNTIPNSGAILSGPFDDDMSALAQGPTTDASIIEFDLSLSEPDVLEFEYIFASEEYEEFIFKTYSDKMGIFISGPGINGPFENNAEIISTVDFTGEPVNINSINSNTNSDLYVSNAGNIENIQYDGLTTKLTAYLFAEPEVTYHVKIVVADMIDGVCDSGIFLSYNSLGNEISTLQPRADFEVFKDVAVSGDTIFAPGNSVKFYNRSKYTSSVLWDFGNGETSESTGNTIYYEPGTYLVNLNTYNYCCSDSVSYTLVVPEMFEAEVNVLSHLSCAGNDDGQISVDFSGGTGNYDVDWIPTITDLNAVTAGTYTYTIDDGYNDPISGTIEVLEPEPLVTVELVENKVLGQGGSIVVSPDGGVEPYEILWSNGESTLEINNLNEGTYSFTITDAVGCQTQNYVDLFFVLSSNVEVENASLLCHGDSNAFIDLQIGGGNPPYDVLWTPAINPMGNPAGIYNYQVVDAQGTQISGEIEITEPEMLTGILDVSPVTETENGSILITPEGGTEPYNFNWSTGDTTALIDDLEGGMYSVTITDANGCMYSTEITVETNLPLAVELDVENNPLDCYGDMNAVINLNIIGGQEPYVVNWNPLIDPSAVGAGEYEYLVMDATGAEISGSVMIIEPEILELNVEIEDTVEGMANGKATANISGGTLPYSYLWSNEETTKSIENLESGFYTVIVTDANGCEEFISFEVKSVLSSQSSNSAHIDVYPNPTSDKVSFKSSEKIKMIRVYDMNGVLVSDDIFLHNGNTISLNHLSSGLYFIEVYFVNNDQRIFKKVILK